jgi:hypothetical protein
VRGGLRVAGVSAFAVVLADEPAPATPKAFGVARSGDPG